MTVVPAEHENITCMDIGPLRKKELAKWTLNASVDRQVDASVKSSMKAVEVLVHLSEEPLTKGGPSVLMFTATSARFREPLKDTDLQSLRKKVQREVNAQFRLESQLVWEDYLQVEFNTDDAHLRPAGVKSQVPASLSLIYTRVKRGVAPDGKAYCIVQRATGVSLAPFPDSIVPAPQSPEEGNSDFLFKELGKTVSYLPATPENIAALDSVQAQLRLLARRLEGLLHQDMVQKSLSEVSLHRFLSAPERSA